MADHEMLRRPAYFDSQAQAAATLKIDISELREAKAEGWAAFGFRLSQFGNVDF